MHAMRELKKIDNPGITLNHQSAPNPPEAGFEFFNKLKFTASLPLSPPSGGLAGFSQLGDAFL